MIRAARLRKSVNITSSRPPQVRQRKRACSSAAGSGSTPSNGTTRARDPAAGAADKRAEKPTTAAAAPALDASRAVAPKRSEWRPSEAHRASATSVARKAQSAKPKARVTPRAATPAATASGTNKARSPGLRRRDLLGGAEDIQLQAKVAAASATPSPASDAAAAARDGPALSVVSLSATNRFRARRELERLAAAGNAEAVEALRASGSSSTFSSASSSEPGSEAGQGERGAAAAAGGLTPLTVLPVLLALVGAGYCVVNDLVPHEWLLWVGVGGDGTGAGAGGSARAEGREPGEEEGDAWSLSPLLRTLSRVAAVVPAGSTNASNDAASTENGGGVLPEAGAASTAAAVEDGRGGGADWSFGGWWRRENEVASAVEDSDDVAAVVDGEIESAEEFVLVEGQIGDDADERQQQKPPRWLRWRAPPQAPPGSS